MTYQLYDKPYKTPDELLLYLKSKNLIINNEEKAKKVLSDINYFRFKSYLRPFLNNDRTNYINNTTFEQAYELYKFDTQLRNDLFSIISRIEIKLRSKLDQIITSFTKNSFWYLDKNNFINNNNSQLISNLSNIFLQSRDEFILHFKNKYVNKTNKAYKHMPPFWFIAEISTFGNILNIYKNLNKNIFNDGNKNILDLLAQEFGAANLVELNKWLILIKSVRNKCAHHSRVWNSNYPAIRKLIPDPDDNTNNRNRIYSLFCILYIITNKLNMDINIKELIINLEEEYPEFKNKESSCGFPADWQNKDFWN